MAKTKHRKKHKSALAERKILKKVVEEHPEVMEMLVKDEKRLLVEEMDRRGFELTEAGKAVML